ncbi:mitochondrial 37S ribosomal protein uS17m [Colletotrichum truncatum]|uniref:Ribosomal protein s17 n=1 Tax=Colletotrichum truncatum TaxID=5467 RepID=A0ACC3YXL8_COLTU|nr:ribosomal protein s17 [Colletotrichum truncatum]KAF6791014.1 ribosomal protein s17 [Colletotrichum truncatum]
MSNQVTTAVRQVFRELHGVVVSAGLMQKTVKVRVGGQQWNQKVQKMFTKPKNYLVHDPNSSLRTGDVVSIVPGWRTSRHKRHVVKGIIAPHATPIEERPPIPTEEERLAARMQKRDAKDTRRAARRQEDGLDRAKKAPGAEDE